MKTHLSHLLALTTSLSLYAAEPRQALPPYPESTLFMERFDNSDSIYNKPILAEGTQLVESWSGYALSVPDGAFIGWTTNGSGYAAVNPVQGTLRFWYSPTWSSGYRTSPSVGVLLETVAWTKNPFPLLAVNILPDGSGLAVTAGGKTPILGVPINWRAGEWHQVSFTYSAKATALYIDGVLATTGPGISLNLTSKAVFGLCLGSDINATSQAEGSYDEVTTFREPVTAEEVAFNYKFYGNAPSLGPISDEEIEARQEMRAANMLLASSTLRASPQPMDATPIDCTSGPLHLTNIMYLPTNTAYVTIAGGQSNTLYDVFRTAALVGPITNGIWFWVGRGMQCDTIVDTNAISPNGFYIAADTTDSDGDGLTDAYEALVVKSNPYGAPSVFITSPSTNTVADSPTNIVINTSTIHYLGAVTTTLYVNGALTATAVGDSPSFQWTEPAVGEYDLQAKLVDEIGETATSSVVHVSIAMPAHTWLQCWLKPETVTNANNTYLTFWADSSGNSNNATASVAPTFSTNQINGKAAVLFNAYTFSYLKLPARLTNAGQAEVFAVLKPTSGPIWTFTADTYDFTSYTPTAIVDSFGSQSIVTLPNSLSGFQLFNVAVQPGANRYWINGLPVYSGTNQVVGFGTNFTIGAPNFSSSFILPEFLFYTNNLSEDQRLAVGRYLNSRYLLVTNAPNITALHCQASEPAMLAVNWTTTNASVLKLQRSATSGGTNFPTFTSTAANFQDNINPADSISYTLTARNLKSDVTATLTTPLIIFTSPDPEARYLLGQGVPISLAPTQLGPGMGDAFTPSKIELYGNSDWLWTMTNAPWSYAMTNTLPNRWNLQAKVYDTSSNNRFSPTVGYNAVADLDSDGDGVPDSQDYFPYDPTRWAAPAVDPGDHTAPVIVITEPQ